MLIEEWFDRLRDVKHSFSVIFGGATEVSPLSGIAYVHWESVLFWGQSSEYSRMMYHTEHPFQVYWDNQEIEINYRKLRTYLAPSFDKEMKRPEFPGNGEAVADIFEEGVSSVRVQEFGLIPDRQYHVLPNTEEYYLPPRDENSAPKTRVNRLLIVSDREFGSRRELGESTPLYRGWSY